MLEFLKINRTRNLAKLTKTVNIHQNINSICINIRNITINLLDYADNYLLFESEVNVKMMSNRTCVTNVSPLRLALSNP